jgi:hypothetical protein
MGKTNSRKPIKPIGEKIRVRKIRRLGVIRKFQSAVTRFPVRALRFVGLGKFLPEQKFRLRRSNMISKRVEYIELPSLGKRILLIGEIHTQNFNNGLRPEIPVMEPVALIDKILEGSAGPVDVFLEVMYISRDSDVRPELPDSPLRKVFYKYEDKLLFDKPLGEDHRFHYADVRPWMFNDFCKLQTTDPVKCGMALTILLAYGSSYKEGIQTIKRYLWDEPQHRWLIEIDPFVEYLRTTFSRETYIEKSLVGKELSKIQNPEITRRFARMIQEELNPIPEREFETLRTFLRQVEVPGGTIDNFYIQTALPTLYWSALRALDFYFLARAFKNEDFRRIIFMGGSSHVESISQLLVRYFDASPKTVTQKSPEDFHVVHLDDLLPLIGDRFMT